jgi:two-component system sensor histidine kinase/response regulator
LAATRLLRRETALAAMPILAMTANALQVDRQRCIEAGMDDFITKPIEPDDLWEALARWVKPREGLGGAAAAPGASPLSSTEDASALPAGIPGLNTQLGLRRVMGKQSLYLSMLRKFVAGQGDVVRQIGVALADGQVELAVRRAHTLRGLAGNIGAEDLQAAAGRVETALASGQDAAVQMAALDTALAAIVSPLTRALQSQSESAAAPEAPAEPLAPVLSRLRSLLADADPEATEYFNQHSQTLRASLGTARARVETAIADYDFEDALAALAQIDA